MMSQGLLPSAEQRKQEKLPAYMDFNSKSIAPPAENMRYYLSPTNGNAFSASPTSGPIISFSIPCGSPGVYLNTLETALVLTLVNNTGSALTLDGSGVAVIEAVDVYYGSSHISSIQGYNNFVNTLSDFTSLGQHYVRGVDDFAVQGAVDAANIKAAVMSRKGKTIADKAAYTFMLPLVNCLGSLAQKAIPLSQLRDSIRLDIRLAGGHDWGVYAGTAAPSTTSGFNIINPKLWLTQIRISGDVENALIDSLPNRTIHVPCFDVQSFQTSVQGNAGGFSYQIPIKASSVGTVLVTMRDTVQGGSHTHRALSRDRANIESYRFRIGATIIPSTFIDCSGSAAEARMELQRALNQISSADSHSWVDNALYTKQATAAADALSAGDYGAFAFALNLSAFSMQEILSDGRSTRNEHVVLDVKFKTGNQPPLRVDVYCIKEQLLVAQGGIMHYED